MFFNKVFQPKREEKANLYLPDLNSCHQEILNDYAQRLKEKLREIGDFITKINPQDTRFITNALITELWSLENVTPTFNRIFQTSIDIIRQDSTHLRGALFDALDYKLAMIKKMVINHQKILEKQEKNLDQQAQIVQLEQQKLQVDAYRICAKLLRIQATSVLCEVGAQHFLYQFITRVDHSFIQDRDNVHYKALVKAYTMLNLHVTKFSLDNLGKNIGLEPYSGTDTLETRCAVEYIILAAIEALIALNNENLLHVDEKEELLSNLKKARVFFNAKNEINYNLPTLPTETEKKRIKYTQRLDDTAVTLGTITLSLSAVGFFHPTALAAGAITGVGASIAGLGSTVLQATNAVENFIKYSTPLQKQEAVLLTLVPVMMLLNTKGVTHAIPITAELIKDGSTSISALQSVKLFFQRTMRNQLKELIQQKNSTQIFSNSIV